MNLFVLEIHNLAIDNEGAIPIVVNRRRSVKFKALGRFFISIHQRLVKSEVDFQEMEVFKVLGDAVYRENLFRNVCSPFLAYRCRAAPACSYRAWIIWNGGFDMYFIPSKYEKCG